MGLDDWIIYYILFLHYTKQDFIVLSSSWYKANERIKAVIKSQYNFIKEENNRFTIKEGIAKLSDGEWHVVL